MLVLTRTVGERIVIGDQNEIVVRVVRVSGDQVRLGIEADASIPVRRIEPDTAIPTSFVKSILGVIS